MNKLVKVIWISLVLFSCSISNSSLNYDYTYLYDSDQAVINPKYKVFHNNDQLSTLYFELNSDDILYGKTSYDTSFSARLKIRYQLFESREMKTVLDSGTVPLVNTGTNSANRILQSKVSFKADLGKVYFMEVRFRDVNKDLNVVNTFFVDKRLNLNSQFFLLKSGTSVLIEEMNRFSRPIEIEKSASIKEDNFIIEQSSQSFELTPPPFIKKQPLNFDFKVDNNFTFQFVDNKFKLENYTAINRIKPRSDTSNLYAYFFSWDKSYPKVSKLSEMIGPIRYISTNNEYKELNSAVNKKLALDKFWLKLAKDEDRAKKVIKEFYERVETSNRFFTDYKEGWKTDRGIIYIIYGDPTNIYKTVDKEVWIYGEENNILSVKYEFYRRNNDLTFNDYELQRSTEYKSNWYRAVDLWRQAKIY